MHDPEWHAAILATLDSVPELADRFLEAFMKDGGYGNSDISSEELLFTAQEVFTTLLETLLGESTEADLKMHADSLGRRRAQQEAPIATLVDAIQLDFTVIWNHLRTITGEQPPEMLITHVDELHQVVTRYNYYVRDAFRREEARKLQDASLANARYLDRLFSSHTINSMGLVEVSKVLGIPIDSTYEVLVFHPSVSVEARAALRPITATGDVLGHGYRGMFAVFWDISATPPTIPEQAMHLPGIRFQDINGLKGVRNAVRSAPTLFDATEVPATIELARDLMWAVAGDALATIDNGQLERVTRAIASMKAKKDPILDTLKAYLHTGSIKETAQQSYCHRNTVINRLTQFANASGADVTLPMDAALVLLALHRKQPPPKPVER